MSTMTDLATGKPVSSMTFNTTVTTSSLIRAFNTLTMTISTAFTPLTNLFNADRGPVMHVNHHALTRGLHPTLYGMRSWRRWGPEARVRGIVRLRQVCARVVAECDDTLLDQYRGETWKPSNHAPTFTYDPEPF